MPTLNLHKPIRTFTVSYLDAGLPVSVAELKSHCRIDNNIEDALVAQYIAAACDRVELELQQKLRRQRLQIVFESFGNSVPFSGLLLSGAGSDAAVVNVRYTNTDGVNQAMPVTHYRTVGAVQKYVVPRQESDAQGWPDTHLDDREVTVLVECGFRTVPAAVKQWILMAAGAMYNLRETHVDRSLTAVSFVDHLLDPYRLPLV